MDGMLDWKQGLEKAGGDARVYAQKLRAFMQLADASPAVVFAALNRGELDKARESVHEVRVHADELGCTELAARGRELELAVRAGADTEMLYGRYATAVPDTLCAIAGYLAG